MILVEEKRKQRFQFLNLVYEHTDGNEDELVNMYELGEALNWGRDTPYLVCQYLRGEYLIEFVTHGGDISITHRGVVEIEKALTQPEEATNYFPPVINIIGDYVQGDKVNGDKVGGDKI